MPPSSLSSASAAPAALPPSIAEALRSVLVKALVGLTVCFIVLISALSYPAIVFQGPLLGSLPAGLGLGLIATAILAIGVALGSSYPGSISHPHSAPTIMLSVVVLELLKDFSATLTPQTLLPTVLGLIAVSALLSGLLLYAVGRFRLANMIRFVPLPVIAGILAGSGWLLLSRSINAATGKPMAGLLSGPATDLWMAGLTVAAAVGLWALDRVRPRPTNLALALLTMLLGFWTVAAVTGNSHEALIAQGWLFPPVPSADLWTPAGHWQAMREANWSAIARMLPLLLIVALINAFGFMVYTGAIEHATESDIDLNRDARRIGLANCLVGLAGGMPGYQNSSLSIMVHRFGMPLRAIGVGSGLACLAFLALGGSLLAYVPKIVAGTMLAYLGLNLLQEWLRTKTRLMSAMDRAVVLLVFLSAIFLGFIQALAVGAVAGIVLFVVRYSGIPVARTLMSGADCQSSTERSEEARAFLSTHGREILILRLHGFIFFGSANRLVSLVAHRLEQHDLPPLRHLVLDLRLVSGLDVSALASFAKLERHAAQHGFSLLISHVPAAIDRLLRSGFAARKEPGPLRFFDQSDQALEWAEDRQLEKAGLLQADSHLRFEEQARQIFGPEQVASALRYFDVIEIEDRAVLSHQGDASTDMYFIERGHIAVLITSGGNAAVRLSLMGPGALVGEIAFYRGTHRSASLVAHGPTALRRLRREQLERMQRDDPLLASALHSHIARALANKLVELHRMVRALNH